MAITRDKNNNVIDEDIPYVLVHLDHQSAKLQMQVTDVATGRNWQFFVNDNYEVRNASATGFFAIPFDGTTFVPSGRTGFAVPNGQYFVTVRVLKALGNPDNPADWEINTSLPILTIARP
jgi:hypothetical protein